MNHPSRPFSGLRLCAGLAGALLLAAACASTPPAPADSLAAARVAISSAEKAEAGRFASEELGEARQKLVLADSAVAREDMVDADRLAQQSRAEAELATARTEAAKAAAINAEMSKGADALTEEMQRAGEQR